ncbi:MAG: DUF1801 domain-containing protein [Gammaproteobacteria bacterium]|nr:DUF1801 domain-containing protein [Gammaproteobacteria bacterium]
MAKKIQLKSAKTEQNVLDYIESLASESDREQALDLLKIFESATGMTGRMWGASIIGFGEYSYHRANGAEGTYLATGFSMRKSGPTLYIMPGYQDYSDILKDLGEHKLGKSCLYLKRLSDVDTKVLTKIIKTGLMDLKAEHETNY